MRLDITTLMSFYDSPLGQSANRAILERINALWGDLSGLDVLGIGYAPPFLEGLEGKPRRSVCLMPHSQGAHAWPDGERGSATALSNERELPFMDAIFDRILVIHALEETAHATDFLREIWRVSAPQARILIITPNRSGVWSLSDSTPFGYGRPFSQQQLKRLMRDALIEPSAWTRSLYTPPIDWKIFTSSSEGWERAGEIFVANFGGVNLVEGTKRVQIDPKTPEKARVVVPSGLRPAVSLNKDL